MNLTPTDHPATQFARDAQPALAGLRVLIVIVNYRTPGMVVDCLASIQTERAALGGLRVVVVDNASGDDSVPVIRAAIDRNRWGSWIEFIASEHNSGFSAGNNVGYAADLGSNHPADYYLLLNPDTIIHGGAVAALLDFMVKNPAVGIAGSRLEDPDRTPQIAAFRFPGVINEFELYLGLGVCTKLLSRWIIAPPVRTEPHETDWVAGASMMVRREVFQKIGTLDEGYFLYFDEVDFCIRARRAGFQTWYVPQSRVIHLVGQSTQISETRIKAKRRPTYWFDSRRRFFLKNYGPVKAALADLAAVVGIVLGAAQRGVRGKSDNTPPKFLGDMIRNSVFFRGFRL